MRGPAIGVALAAALALGGCGKSRSQVVLGILTDFSSAPAAPDRLELVRLAVDQNGVPREEKVWTISGRPGVPYELPGSVGLFSKGNGPVQLEARLNGYLKGGATVERRAKFTILPSQTLFLRMALLRSCLAVKCPSGETCIDGGCRGIEVDPNTLPAYVPGDEGSLACPGSARRTSDGEPLPVRDSCKPDEICVEGTCYKRPLGDGGAQGGVDAGAREMGAAAVADLSLRDSSGPVDSSEIPTDGPASLDLTVDPGRDLAILADLSRLPDRGSSPDLRAVDAGRDLAAPIDLSRATDFSRPVDASVDLRPAVSCQDGLKNGLETDVDCGGGVCPRCRDGQPCLLGADCQAAACCNRVCGSLCTAKARRCLGNSVETCADDGCAWRVTSTCDDNNACTQNLCAAGACANPALPNDCGNRNCGASPSGCFQCGSCSPNNDCINGRCTPKPCITVDDSSADFGKGCASGNPFWWPLAGADVTCAENGSALFTYTNGGQQDCYGLWQFPTALAGRYDIYVRIPKPATPKKPVVGASIQYNVYWDGVSKVLSNPVDQRFDQCTWKLIMQNRTITPNVNTPVRVTLGDAWFTYQQYIILFDAVRLCPI